MNERKRPPRRPRTHIERGIFTYEDRFGRVRYGVSYTKNGRLKRELLSAEIVTLEAARFALRRIHTEPVRPTFADFAAQYAAARAKEIPASIARVRGTFKIASGMFGDIPIDKVTALHVQSFKAARLAVCAAGTVKRDIVVLSELFRDACRRGLRDQTPFFDLQLGLCSRCGHPSLPDMDVCLRHQLTSRLRARVIHPATQPRTLGSNTKWTRIAKNLRKWEKLP